MDSGSKCSFDSSTKGQTCPMHTEEQKGSENPSLSREREISSIPRADGTKWIYPSEKMFFDAMKRKNHKPNERDMHSIIPIHNIVNERVWQQIKQWEDISRGECEIKLVKFQGKAKEFSIRARIFNLFGYKLPFDRHDWTIDRCGEEVVYVIDFYQGENSDARPSFYLDVRPYPNAKGIYETIRYHLNKLW
jgi:cytochrome c heme-lyase